jgi:hypothetical protein
MGRYSQFDAGALAGFLAALGGIGGNWLLTRHPGATSLNRAFAILEVVAGFGGALWLYLRYRTGQR